jgi:DNA polymerase-4
LQDDPSIPETIRNARSLRSGSHRPEGSPVRPASLQGAAMDVCAQSVFTPPASEAVRASTLAAERHDHAGCFDPRTTTPDSTPRSTSETPPTEPAATNKPRSAWAWLGPSGARQEKKPGSEHRGSNRSIKIPNIVHVEVEAFFASVEQELNPRLRGKPVLVGRGVVASASREAQFLGVRTAMSLGDALQICPKAVVVPSQYERYADYAEHVRRILETYTPAVEAAALEDFYLDFSSAERPDTDLEATLLRLQAEIFGRTGLSVSVGAARSKVVASIASGLQRPRGFRVVTPGEEESFLSPLPAEKLHGIGYVHGGVLAERGITTIGQLRQVPKLALQAAFGEAIGQQIWELARGLDGRKRLPPLTPESIIRETTIESGTLDQEFLRGLAEYLSARVGSTLRECGKQAGSIGLHIRYVDHFSAQQSVRLDKPTNNERELWAAAKDLFDQLVTRRAAIRLVGLSVTNLEADRLQQEQFHADTNWSEDFNRCLGSLRRRYGWLPANTSETAGAAGYPRRSMNWNASGLGRARYSER